MAERKPDLAALATYFERQADVSAAWLFGSLARGAAGPLSDVDLAVVLSGPTERQARRRDALCADLMGALHRDDADLVLFEMGSPLLRHRVIRDNVQLLAHDPRQLSRPATAAVIEYLDTAPLRAALRFELNRSLAEGCFGQLPDVKKAIQRVWSSASGSRGT